jgi:hypothetical protein
MNQNFPDPDMDIGVITHGSCPSPEDQEAFDAEEEGRPPVFDE